MFSAWHIAYSCLLPGVHTIKDLHWSLAKVRYRITTTHPHNVFFFLPVIEIRRNAPIFIPPNSQVVFRRNLPAKSITQTDSNSNYNGWKATTLLSSSPKLFAQK